MKGQGGKFDDRMLNIGEVDVSVATPLDILWDNNGRLTMKYTSADGEVKTYDPEAFLGQPVDNGYMKKMMTRAVARLSNFFN